MEVRALYAAAHNALIAFRRAKEPDAWADDIMRYGRKMAQLDEAVKAIEPLIEAHFAEQNTKTPPRAIPGGVSSSR